MNSFAITMQYGIVLGALILLFLAFPAPVSQAAPLYTAAPLVIDIEALPRDILTRKITLTNTGTQPVTLYATVNNISLDAGGTIQEFVPPVMSDRTTSLSSWIEITRAGTDLGVGESKEVELTLRVVPNPQPGVYHAYIGFAHGETRDEAERKVTEGRAPGVVVTVAITDEKKEILKLSRFNISRFVTSVDNQAATYIINNPGDKPLVPTGDIIIYNNRGTEVASLAVNNEKIEIPPGEAHTFTIDMPIASLFGKYKAFLDVEFGNAQRGSIQDTAFFYVFPLKIIIPIFIGFALVCVIIALIAHRRYVGDDDLDPSGAERIVLNVRDTTSEACEHDIVLKK